MRAPTPIQKTALQETMGSVIKKTFSDPTYTMIFLGFFSCVYQLAFITAHFPAFITEMCSTIAPLSIFYSIGISPSSTLGAVSITLIGLANVASTLMAGHLGNKFSKKYLLSLIYLSHTVIAAFFIMIPMTPTTVVMFSVIMGSLWLASVPLTSGLIAHIYRIKYMGTLYGIVFFSHQLGSFLGFGLVA